MATSINRHSRNYTLFLRENASLLYALYHSAGTLLIEVAWRRRTYLDSLRVCVRNDRVRSTQMVQTRVNDVVVVVNKKTSSNDLV